MLSCNTAAFWIRSKWSWAACGSPNTRGLCAGQGAGIWHGEHFPFSSGETAWCAALVVTHTLGLMAARLTRPKTRTKLSLKPASRAEQRGKMVRTGEGKSGRAKHPGREQPCREQAQHGAGAVPASCCWGCSLPRATESPSWLYPSWLYPSWLYPCRQQGRVCSASPLLLGSGWCRRPRWCRCELQGCAPARLGVRVRAVRAPCTCGRGQNVMARHSSRGGAL